MTSSVTQPLALDRFVSPAFYTALIFLFVILFIVLQLLDANQSLFFTLNEVSANILPDVLAAHLTELGNGGLVGILALILVIKNPDSAKRFLFITLLTAIVIAGLKHFFNDPRPAGVLALTDFHVIGDVLKKYSFPSGHTTTAFAMAGFILLTYQNIALRSSVLVLALIAGMARISVGAHWPEDVLAGAALGLVLAFIGSYFSQQPFQLKGSYMAASFLALAALIGNLTAPADFPAFESIAFVRYLFAVLATAALVYFGWRIVTLLRT